MPIGIVNEASGGLVELTEAKNTAAPNATVPVVSLTPSGAEANIDVALKPKGTGALSAQVADDTTAGGNKRGTNSVDWQRVRSDVTYVASGASATIGGGAHNKSSSTYSVVGGGLSNSATGAYSAVGGGASNTSGGSHSTVGGGDQNSANGFYSTVGGGSNNQAVYQDSTIPGGSSATARGPGVLAYASGNFTQYGDAQFGLRVLRGRTTNATPKALTTNNNTGASNNQVSLTDGSSFAFKGHLIARDEANGDTLAVEFKGAVKCAAGAVMSLVGTPTVTDLGRDAGASAWVVALSTGSLRDVVITVTGEAGKTIRWLATVDTAEILN